MAEQVLWSSASYANTMGNTQHDWFTKANTIVTNVNLDDATIVGGIWNEILVNGAKHLKVSGIFETLGVGLLTALDPAIYAYVYGEPFDNSHGIRPPMLGVDVVAGDGNRVGGSNRLATAARSWDMDDFTSNGGLWTVPNVTVDADSEPIAQAVNPAIGNRRGFTFYVNEGVRQRPLVPQLTQSADMDLSDFYKIYVAIKMYTNAITGSGDLTLKGEIAAVLG